ncbi:MAG: hypothetical protein SFU91_13095 [Chloroherpetonaceae bacterium]|nr:hypothetical protein [Chloroherpetonaceae bacterium]
MLEVYSYPLTQSEFLIDNYALLTWSGAAIIIALVWAIFFRYGNFRYGIDLGCLLKTGIIIVVMTFCLGMPNYLNTKFYAAHSFEGDKITLNDNAVLYETRNGSKKTFQYTEIKQIYQEPITYNPPVTYYVVAVIDVPNKLGRVDSIGIRQTLPNYSTLLNTLSAKTGLKVEKNP